VRRVIVSEFVSLDGVNEDANGARRPLNVEMAVAAQPTPAIVLMKARRMTDQERQVFLAEPHVGVPSVARI
jgi:hypothetical protein